MQTSADVALAPEQRAPTDPSFPTLDEAVAAAEHAGVAGRPLFGAVVLGAWIISGLVVARYLARRGHEAGPVTVLGVITGPLLFGVARANLIPREKSTRPIVLTEGASSGGVQDVLIAIGDGAPFEDVIAPVRALGPRLRRLTLVHCVTFELAWDDDDDACRARDEAAGVLSHAALHLPGVQPRLVILPGATATAVDAYARVEGIDQVLHAAPPTTAVHARR